MITEVLMTLLIDYLSGPFSISKLHFKLSSSSPSTIHRSFPSSSSSSVDICTGVESVDVAPFMMIVNIGEDISNAVFKNRFGGERDSEGQAKEEVVDEAEVNVNIGSVSVGEDGVSISGYNSIILEQPLCFG